MTAWKPRQIRESENAWVCIYAGLAMFLGSLFAWGLGAAFAAGGLWLTLILTLDEVVKAVARKR